MATALPLLLLLVVLGGLVYTGLALWAARSFAHSTRRTASIHMAASGPQAAVTLLKPLQGTDDGLYAALESHCCQRYAGAWEIVFGVSTADDPAAAVVAQLQAAYPAVAMRLVVCPERLGTSGKVSNLVQMLRAAQYDHVLINDSDIRVGPEYLARVMQGFYAEGRAGAPPVGMVTAPYRGSAHADARGRIPIWSKLEALGIATDFFPGVLTARLLERGIRFGLGSTLAMRRDALAVAGGLESVLELLADDYELGARIAAAGYRVELAAEIVETAVPPYSFRAFVDHQLRWARSTRDSRRLGYLGVGVTFVLPWALLAAIASGFALPSIALLSIALAARVALALAVGVGLLHDRQVLRDLWLLPLRDGFGLFFWLWSYAGDTVLWRGERFRLRQGRLERLP